MVSASLVSHTFPHSAFPIACRREVSPSGRKGGGDASGDDESKGKHVDDPMVEAMITCGCMSHSGNPLGIVRLIVEDGVVMDEMRVPTMGIIYGIDLSCLYVGIALRERLLIGRGLCSRGAPASSLHSLGIVLPNIGQRCSFKSGRPVRSSRSTGAIIGGLRIQWM
jgi:hypothetical protein